jgi:hypothetical protein
VISVSYAHYNVFIFTFSVDIGHSQCEVIDLPNVTPEVTNAKLISPIFQSTSLLHVNFTAKLMVFQANRFCINKFEKRADTKICDIRFGFSLRDEYTYCCRLGYDTVLQSGR